MPRPSWHLPLLVVLPFITTACAGTADHSAARHQPPTAAAVTATKGADGAQQVTIDTTDMFRFTPTTIHAHVGELRIVLTDHGSYPHNISFPALRASSSTVSGSPGQQKTTFTVTFSHPGTYDFVCTFHSSAGMKGHITVS